MATYKKRGYKPAKEKVEKEVIEQEEINTEDSTTAEVFETLDESANKAEEFVARNQKNIFIFIGIVAICILGYLGFQKFVSQPKAEIAMNDMYKAQTYFNDAVNGVAKDSLYNLSLKGGEGKYGMIDIADKYSGTPAANLANYYAGIAYLNLKDYKNAIKYLQDFDSDDEILAPMAKGAIGDAFVQIGQNDKALEYYLKASKLRTNNFSTPKYLFKAGLIALELGKAGDALSYFKTIKSDYSTSIEGQNIDGFIGRAQSAK